MIVRRYLTGVALSRQGKVRVAILTAVVITLLLASFFAAGQGSAAPAKEKPQPSAAPAADYVGSEMCIGCHDKAHAAVAKTPMGKILLKFPRTATEKHGCEACHGPGSRHIDNPADYSTIIRFDKKSATSLKTQNQACIQCHDKGQHLWWKGSAHEKRGLSCVQCHKVHSGADQPVLTASNEVDLCAKCHPIRKAQTFRNSHMPMREGKLTCTDCHNPHGSNGPSMLTSKSVNENCYRCHADKRGPFLWEHPPVRENCLNCHDPHGTNLIRVKSDRLCQRCHNGTRHPSTPFAPIERRVYNHGCANCHSQVHGSNHPSGNFFLR